MRRKEWWGGRCRSSCARAACFGCGGLLRGSVVTVWTGAVTAAGGSCRQGAAVAEVGGVRGDAGSGVGGAVAPGLPWQTPSVLGGGSSHHSTPEGPCMRRCEGERKEAEVSEREHLTGTKGRDQI